VYIWAAALGSAVGQVGWTPLACAAICKMGMPCRPLCSMQGGSMAKRLDIILDLKLSNY